MPFLILLIFSCQAADAAVYDPTGADWISMPPNEKQFYVLAAFDTFVNLQIDGLHHPDEYVTMIDERLRTDFNLKSGLVRNILASIVVGAEPVDLSGWDWFKLSSDQRQLFIIAASKVIKKKGITLKSDSEEYVAALTKKFRQNPEWLDQQIFDVFVSVILKESPEVLDMKALTTASPAVPQAPALSPPALTPAAPPTPPAPLKPVATAVSAPVSTPQASTPAPVALPASTPKISTPTPVTPPATAPPVSPASESFVSHSETLHESAKASESKDTTIPEIVKSAEAFPTPLPETPKAIDFPSSKPPAIAIPQPAKTPKLFEPGTRKLTFTTPPITPVALPQFKPTPVRIPGELAQTKAKLVTAQLRREWDLSEEKQHYLSELIAKAVQEAIDEQQSKN